MTTKEKFESFVESLTEKDPRNVRIRGAVALEKYGEIMLMDLGEYDPALNPGLLGKERYVKQRMGKIIAQAIRSNKQAGGWKIRYEIN